MLIYHYSISDIRRMPQGGHLHGSKHLNVALKKKHILCITLHFRTRTSKQTAVNQSSNNNGSHLSKPPVYNCDSVGFQALLCWNIHSCKILSINNVPIQIEGFSAAFHDQKAPTGFFFGTNCAHTSPKKGWSCQEQVPICAK